MDGSSTTRVESQLVGPSGADAWKDSRNSLKLWTRRESASQTFDSAYLKFSVALTESLHALAERERLTPFAVLLAAWTVLLARWEGHDETAVDARLVNRDDFGRDGRVEETPPLQLRLEDDPTAQDLLGAAANVLKDASAGTQPAVPRSALSLIVHAESAGFVGAVEYSIDVYDRETVERMVASWKVILHAMTEDAQRAVSRLPMLTGAERALVLYGFNRSVATYPENELIHELFEEQVRRVPERLAVACEGSSINYAELNQRANQLARYLRSRGLQPDEVVGLCIDRSIEMVVAMLGVWKAGGAYMPLDPAYPVNRLTYMLEDAGPRILLTQEHLRDLLPSVSQEIIALDALVHQDAVAKLDTANLAREEVRLTPRNLAYVIYTSGSSGQPKGAMNEHRGMVNRIHAQRTIENFTEDDICCQKTSISFVDAVFETFGALCNGVPLLIVPAAAVSDVARMAGLIRQERVTRLVTVPSLAGSMLDDPRVIRDLAGLRSWTLSGEEVKPSLLQRLQRALPECQFINQYGSSEVSSDAACYPLPRFEGGRVPIGKPVTNVSVYILDRHGEPVPTGVAGEICVGGVGVGRGYINRPELTAERFVRDPFSAGPDSRMYKTGDLGRWRTDGLLECLGRIDNQIKIRGFRVEPGEVEAQLLRRSEVREAVVMAREDVPGDKRLVAYVIPRGSAGRSVADNLRSHLRAVLPEFMVPGAVVFMPEWPRTPNGKLDRRALPAPQADAYAGNPYEAPRDDREEALARIWQELLHVERVGRLDNFFQLGGHSLLIVQLIERLRRAGFSASPRDVYTSATLGELAERSLPDGEARVEVPPNRIPPGCLEITPQMLTLVDLDDDEIRRIVNAVPGGAANVQDIYPLAPLQEGILFHHLLDSTREDAYVASTLLSVATQERLEELISALQAVIDRHDILRTAVLWSELKRPVQVVCREAFLPIERAQIAAGSDAAREILMSGSAEAQRIDLRRAPLMRLRVAEDRRQGTWYALLQIHHIINDDVSLKLLISEVISCLEGRAHALPAAIPYRNHVARVLARAQRGAAEAYFRSKLQDVEEPTAPFELVDVLGDGTQIDEARHRMEPEVTQRIRAQARRLGVSPATLFHASWAVVVARTSGRDDVVFGTVLLGRMESDTQSEQMPGMFINTLPMRLRLHEATARELVEVTRRELAELLDHEQASLAVARRCSGVQGSGSLFSAVLNYRHDTSDARARWSSAPGIRMVAEYERTNYPITLSIDDLGDSFELTTQADRRISPRRMNGYLRTAVVSLLDALERRPETPALALSILPQEEWQQLVRDFNATHAGYPLTQLVHELFEEQVKRTPRALAATDGARSLSYAELNTRANQLAHYLRERGIGPDKLVGLCVERSLDMIVGMLGILKAGGAYVPLDPAYPADRIAHMVEDATPGIILTHERLRDRLPSFPAVALDADWETIARHRTQNPSRDDIELRSNHLAYVIYTSGSTGKPKGVAIEHRNTVNLICWAQYAIQQDALAKTLQSTSLNFDLSVYECFVPLSMGGSITVVDNALALMREAADVSLINTVPSAIKALADSGAIPDSVRVVNLAGEALKKEIVERIFVRSQAQSVCNLYGPTETTTYSTWISMPREGGFLPSVGRPIANTQVYILDRNREVVPLGVTGEIYIGGAGVARGYLNRPELTAERFLKDPFAEERDARMYKTGDLGRWLPDGTLEYLGRNDHQVKIRGFRIELGEIEQRLARHPSVRDVVLAAREDAPGEKRLVAYVVPESLSLESGTPDVERLRAHIKAALPEYMIPSVFVFLEKLPLTPNGKLDRRALPDPESGSGSSRAYEPPQGEVEEVLASVWQSLLKVDRVGRQDNFFELGGHSLLIVEMMERLRRLGIGTGLRRVFESPTLAALARELVGERQAAFEVPPNRIPPGCEALAPEMLPLVRLEQEEIERIVSAVPAGATNIQDIYPLAPLQEGILFHHLMNERRGDTYILTTLLSVDSRQRLDELIEALGNVIRRHDALRTAVLWEHMPRPVQVVCREASLPVEELALDANRDVIEQLNERMRPENQQIELRRAPLVRLQIAADPKGSGWYALLQLHHLVCDHVTAEIVIAELAAYLEGSESTLPPPVPYRNHVAQALAFGKRHDSERFFRERLADVDEPTAPFGLLDVYGDGSRNEEVQEPLDPGLAARLRAQARRLGVSAATLFHAAWGLVVAGTSGRDDVTFGTVLLGRMQSDAGTQRILGMFINTLPLRVRLQGVSCKALIEQTQRELVELLQHEQASLAVAQRCSGISGGAPLFSALLNYRHSTEGIESEFGNARGVKWLGTQTATNYPVVLSVDDLGTGFALSVQTNPRIAPTRMLGYVTTALRGLVEALETAPQTSALDVPIVPPAEWHEIVHTFNATEAAFPEHNLIHELIEEEVSRAPNALAVAYRDESLTYADLNRKANQLARYLRSRGVGPDHLVGLYFERSIELVVGVLAVLKAGGAYVPLDPTNPPERLTHLLSDANPTVVLTVGKLVTTIPPVVEQVVALDRERADIERQDSGNLNPKTVRVTPENLAYVIYTSGSTGKPKGVMVEHRNIVNYAFYAAAKFDVAAGDGSLICSSFSFDLMLTGLYPTLLSGRTARLCREENGLPDMARELLQSRNLSPLKLTPSHLGLLEQALRDGALEGCVKVLVLGGEQLQGSAVELWRKHSPSTRIFNHYGPTETTVGCVVNEVVGPVTGPVPIGRPIANTRVYILDSRMRPVPVGACGDIYVGGAGVARGYLKRPELTQERFLKDPFGSPGRIYRTGDVGRWRPDGTIEYLGRNDHQVKIRGFRIELAEIEAQLVRYPALKEAAVLALEDGAGQKRLVAYVTSAGAERPGVEELRAHLKASLPDYMLPGAFVVLDSLPLTANGKLDRSALPAPEVSAYASREYVAPQGEVEEILAGIWQELLHVGRVGRHDNFFELGGHSLLILQMLERLRKVGLSAQVRRVFENPKLADMAKELTGDEAGDFEVPPNLIPPECRAIRPDMLPLVNLDEQQIATIERAVPGGARNIQDIYPLAPLQEGILFHHLMNPQGGDTYVEGSLLKVASRQRVTELVAAVQRVIDRHDILRTAVLWEQLPQPVQVVCRHATLLVEEIRLPADRDPVEQFNEWMSPELQRLDVRHAPLMRLQIAADPHTNEWYALLKFHHLVSDHESLELLFAELMAFLQGKEEMLPQPVPYRNHVAQALAYAQRHDSERFFREKLGDVDEPTAPFGLLDVYGDGSRIEEVHEDVASELAQRLRAQARRLGVSAATLFHAAWGLVVARTTGRDDVTFGTVLLGRMQSDAGTQRILGMFINTLPLRIRLQGVSSKALIERTQRELVQLLHHEQASLAVAQRCSGVSGSAPLFTSLLNYRHSGRNPAVEWTAENGIRVLAYYGRTNYPILLSVDDLGDGFALTAETDRRIDARRMIEFLLTSLRGLVETLESRPDAEALQVGVLPERERQRVVCEFNDTHAEYATGVLVHELFERQVKETPLETAVVHEGRSLSYEELNRKANRLARHLRSRGVGPDQPVGLCVERSVEMIVGVLGILKAGGAYVPLDPNYPSDRLQYMLEDSAPRVALTQGELRALLPAGEAEVITIEKPSIAGRLRGEREKIPDQHEKIAKPHEKIAKPHEKIAEPHEKIAEPHEKIAEPHENISGQGDENLSVEGRSARDLVYLIYTSGSTGKPKGTGMPHGAMVNLMEWHRATFGSAVGRKVLQFAALSFDVAFQEIFSTLCTGGTLVLLDEWIRRDAAALTQFLTRHEVNRLFVPPLMLQSLAEYCNTSGALPDSIEDVITAGEQLRVSPEIVSLFHRLGDCRLHNHYGPTETHVVTALTLTGNPDRWPVLPTIGKPIWNTQIYILDEQRRPVPVGVTGEIFIGGAGIARGYLSRPDLTAQRFLEDPFDTAHGGRMYRTGDVGRWTPDGEIEYLGRNDQQVKIRGFRIELGEIEAQIAGHEAVREAAVVSREDVQGDKRLVAYVTCRAERTLVVDELRARLKTSLPDFMMPSAFVVLEKLPLTPTGKLDRRSLPAADVQSHGTERYEAPEGAIEEALAAIWQELLHVSRVGRTDNFFEIGGHSLHAMRLNVKIMARFAVAPPVAAVFANPTVQQLAQVVESLREDAETSDPVEAEQEEGVI